LVPEFSYVAQQKWNFEDSVSKQHFNYCRKIIHEKNILFYAAIANLYDGGLGGH
jgi:putative flippase GtrA